MSSPLVSVIVPVYNVEKYLPKCLDSLINQTLKEIEIICINDGSTDNSLEILNNYAKKDSRIKVFSQKNKGRSGARNAGINNANTPYLMFCDSDDWYDKTMCEKMYHAITQHDVDFACCGVKMEYDIRNPMTKKSDEKYYSIKYSGKHLISQNDWKNIDCSVCNKIFKKEIVEKYDIRFPNGLNYEDFCFFFQVFTISQKIYFIPEYLYHYCRHAESIMCITFTKTSIKALDHVKILNPIYDFLLKNKLWNKWKKTFLDVCSVYCSLARTWLPSDKKSLVETEISFLIDKWDLTEDEKQKWLKPSYDSMIEIKFLGLKLLKIKRRPQRSAVFLLGIQIYSRKIKKNKEVFSILYLPIFKRKNKNA